MNKTQETREENIRLPLPKKNKNEMFAIADRLMGGSRVNAICADGKSRMARIPGKMRRIRVRTGDLLIIKPWEIQNEKSDVVYRYGRTQSMALSRKKFLPDIIDVF
ncbi:translation initiation factor 1A [Thermoplasmatales archaeon SG8-52-1]|jgi:translation initiation factor 1A|nr:MAG: translation initiation factor 1A [Thermoplasmatales archaeon SG8-52-1]